MEKKALLIIDVQKAIMDEKPHKSESLINTIADLISACREKNTEVIYVQHDGVDDELAKGSIGWEICDDIKPLQNDKIFDKNFNSAFKDTDLKKYLHNQDITTLILAGMQTEYCIDASIKAAFEYGFKVLIPENGVTTVDRTDMSAQTINDFFYHIWDKRFGKVMTSFDIITSIAVSKP